LIFRVYDRVLNGLPERPRVAEALAEAQAEGLKELFTSYIQYRPLAACNFLQLFFWRTFVGFRQLADSG
jgi:hypothetical protein